MKHLLIPLLLVTTCSMYAQTEPEEISLWDNGAPGFEELKDKEVFQVQYSGGWLRDITDIAG